MWLLRVRDAAKVIVQWYSTERYAQSAGARRGYSSVHVEPNKSDSAKRAGGNSALQERSVYIPADRAGSRKLLSFEI